ncbi:Auxin responsive protein [Musa troglodytarum]|uniref:Auxin responsive protein n=1 Tax=Musa troglodytarum TaxID=320322 RepID=A0A9E7H5N1_9LILI|nr:Auxin responsive protein [Musa troglodytarum]
MESKKLGKITELVSFQQVLKKWKKLAVAGDGSSKALSLSGNIPKGCFAVCVGQEMQRFVIPIEYLSRTAFAVLLREAEEEFGFEQEGVLRIPCEVSVFRSVLKMVEKNKEGIYYC